MNEGFLHSHTFRRLGCEGPAFHFTGEKTEAKGGLDKLSWLVMTLLLRPTAHPAVNPVPSVYPESRHCSWPSSHQLLPTPSHSHRSTRGPCSASALRSFSRPFHTVSSMRPSIAQTLRTPATPTWEAFLATSHGQQHPSCPLSSASFFSVLFITLGSCYLFVAISPH